MKSMLNKDYRAVEVEGYKEIEFELVEVDTIWHFDSKQYLLDLGKSLEGVPDNIDMEDIWKYQEINLQKEHLVCQHKNEQSKCKL